MFNPGNANEYNKIVVVVPVYNESKVVYDIIESLVKNNYRVIVVDDGSEIPVEQALNNLPVFLLRHPSNLGQGAAIQTGFNFARRLHPDVVITFDADGQHSIHDLPAIIEPLIDGEADVCLGSRFLPGGTTTIPFSKKIVLQIARIINLIFSGFYLSDAHNGLRAFNRKALEKIVITENRMAHASEILFEIKKHRLTYKEVPVHIHYTAYSTNKGQAKRDSIKILFDLVLHKLFK